MKRSILLFLLLALASHMQAEDSAYRAGLNAAHERLRDLEIERCDYRKTTTGLPTAKEEERLRLLGQVLDDDPVWVLLNQIQADISALVAIRQRTTTDDALVESLKDFLVIVSGFGERATTRPQAEMFATTLRQFIARRDVTGASTWAKSQ